MIMTYDFVHGLLGCVVAGLGFTGISYAYFDFRYGALT